MTHRRGISSLVLIVVLVLMVAVVQVFQHSFTEQVTDQVARAVHGRTAHGIATAALAEARTVLMHVVNDPDSSAFREARTARAPVALPLKVEHLERTLLRIREAYDDSYDLSAVSATLTARAGITGHNHLEYDGDLAIDVGVRSKIDRGVERRVSSSWGYRVIELSTPGELHKSTALIRTPEYVIKGRWDVPALTRKWVTQDIPTLIREVQKAITDMEAEKSRNPSAAGQLDQLKALYSPLVEGANGGRLGAALAAVDAPLRALPELPAQASGFLLHATGAELPVGELDLQGDFDELTTQHRDLSQLIDRLAAQIRQASGQGPHPAYVDAVGRIAEVMSKSAARYLRFRTAFQVVTAGSPAFVKLAESWNEITPTGRLPAFAEYPAFDQRVCVVLKESTAAPVSEDGVKQWLAPPDPKDGAFCGILMVENPRTALRLSGALRGRWTLVVSGSLVLDGVTRERPEDTFTIVHMDSADGGVSLNGRVDATVITSGRKLTVPAGTQITGGLFVEDVMPGSRIDPTGESPEKITLDTVRAQTLPAVLSRVVLSPWTRSSRSDRKID